MKVEGQASVRVSGTRSTCVKEVGWESRERCLPWSPVTARLQENPFRERLSSGAVTNDQTPVA